MSGNQLCSGIINPLRLRVGKLFIFFFFNFLLLSLFQISTPNDDDDDDGHGETAQKKRMFHPFL